MNVASDGNGLRKQLIVVLLFFKFFTYTKVKGCPHSSSGFNECLRWVAGGDYLMKRREITFFRGAAFSSQSSAAEKTKR